MIFRFSKPPADRARTAFLAHRARDVRARTVHVMMRSRAQRKETFGLRVRRGKNARGVPDLPGSAFNCLVQHLTAR